MQIIKNPYILAIIPFIAIMFAGYVLDVFPNNGVVVKVLDLIAEKDLEELLKKAGLTKTSKMTYQCLRIGSSFAISLILLTLAKHDLKVCGIYCLVAAVITYKLLYFFLVYKEKERINKLNSELPYCMKTIACLCHLYPVNNAFEKAIDYVPDVFKYDIETLLKDIDEDPLSFGPYQKWVDRYDNKLNMLKTYLREFHRMSMSSSTEQEKMLANINSSISNETRRVRLNKNSSTNSLITWLGMIPVMLLGMMLMSLLVVIIEFI